MATEFDTNNSQEWEYIYIEGDTSWDLGRPTPVFVDIAKNYKPANICILGCGHGYDAIMFSKRGFNVTAVDFAPSAVEAINKYAELNDRMNAFQGDILDLPFDGEFDYVLEHTCYCAIPRENRQQYVESAWKVLKPGGLLFGLFYRFDPEDDKGPPHTTSENEIDQLFGERFNILEMSTPQNSHGRRQGRERLIIMKRK